MFFLVVGAVSATELNNVSNKEDSNLMSDNVNSLSVENKLEISSEDSISQTNIVNSHDDDLNNCSGNDVLSISNEDDYGKVQASNVGDNSPILSATNNSVLSVSSSHKVLSASPSKVATKLSVVDPHYGKSATYFKVTLKDAKGKAVKNQKVFLKVNGVKYSARSDKNGIALIKAAHLKVGTYNVAIAYSGNSNYTASSLSKKVKVLRSIIGSDMTKYYGYSSKYKVTVWKNNYLYANAKVTMKVNGKAYKVTTNSKGVASLSIILKPGKYTITSTNPYSGEKLSNKIVVKKDGTTLSTALSNVYIAKNTQYPFTVTLKSKHNVLIKNKEVSFTYNNKTVTAKTNEKGKATITIPVLPKGTYPITFKTKDSSKYYGASGSAKLIVHSPTTKLTSSALKMVYNDGSKFRVKLTDSNDKPLAKKNIRITVHGVTYTKKTNSNGYIYLKIGLKPDTYKVTYNYQSVGSKDYSYGSNKIVVSKLPGKISAGNLVMKYKDGSVYKAIAKDKSGKVLKNAKVKFTIKGKSYTVKTDKKGVARLKIGLGVGYYTIKTALADDYYESSTVSKHVLVDGTKFVASDLYVTPGKTAVYSVKLVNGKNNPIKKAKVTFTIDKKNYKATTDSKGIAKVKLSGLSKGVHKIKYTQGKFSGSSNIHVVNAVTIKQIVSASKTIKSYVEKKGKLPSTVKMGGVSYDISDYLYLASKAIINLKAGKTNAIPIKAIKDPSKPSSTYSAGNLNDYLSVAKSIVKTADSKGQMPNSVSSKIGTIGYKQIVYAFARVVSFYDDNGRMPSYVEIKAVAKSSSTVTVSGNGLNQKNTIKDLTAFLSSSANCQVNNKKIKEIVTKLTKGLKSDEAKARAIFNYVRDTVSYSFYYDTKYGAVGTLNAKTGNCVDHSHLLVAMFRTANLASRYVHGTCTFSSGGTYGHVWTQVLIGNTWTVADATSTRNSLGHVANWNTGSYSLHSISSGISF